MTTPLTKQVVLAQVVQMKALQGLNQIQLKYVVQSHGARSVLTQVTFTPPTKPQELVQLVLMLVVLVLNQTQVRFAHQQRLQTNQLVQDLQVAPLVELVIVTM
jgi:hypothetical protein